MIEIKDSALRNAAENGIDEFLGLIANSIKAYANNVINTKTFELLNSSQMTLWIYTIIHEEVMDGGFIQLIHNGYGPLVFDNPFAKAMRLWDLKEFSKLIYKAKELYDEHKSELTKDMSEEEFMALFEQYPAFDDLDDKFIENEEEYTYKIAQYVDNHLDEFIKII